MTAWWASLSWPQALLVLDLAFLIVCVVCIAIGEPRAPRNRITRPPHASTRRNGPEAPGTFQ